MGEIVEASARLDDSGPLIAVGQNDFFDDENLDVEFGFAVADPATLQLDTGLQMTRSRRPEIEKMVSVMHVGDEADGHRRVHHAIGRWLAAHGFELAGPGREIMHQLGDGETLPLSRSNRAT